MAPTHWLAALASAAAATALKTAGLFGAFVFGSGLAGMAHEGISTIPKDGTWLLQKGERVVDSQTNKDLKAFLKGGNGKGGANITVNINGGDEEGVFAGHVESLFKVVARRT